MNNRAVFFFAFFIIWMPRALASSEGAACHDLILQVVERGEGEIAPDVCGSSSSCQEEAFREGGGLKKRFVRLKVVAGGVGSSCPSQGSVYRVQGVITEARIRATLILADGQDAGRPAEKLEFRNIRSMGGFRLPGLGPAIAQKE